MKRFTLLLVALLAFSFSGCSELERITTSATPSVSAATSSTIVVRAEQTLKTARDTFDTLFQLEYNHKDYIKSNFPMLHRGVNALRAKVPDALIALDNAKNTFKHSRNSSNEADLMTALKTINELVSQAKDYTEQLNRTSP